MIDATLSLSIPSNWFQGHSRGMPHSKQYRLALHTHACEASQPIMIDASKARPFVMTYAPIGLAVHTAELQCHCHSPHRLTMQVTPRIKAGPDQRYASGHNPLTSSQ